MYSRVVSFVIIFISLAATSPIEETSTRSAAIEEGRKASIENTKTENVVLDLMDVRTPPRIKLKQEKLKYENSHPGIAIPVDEDSINIEEGTTKKFNFYKLERPTTDSSISTWILLSGQPLTTNKPTVANSTNNAGDDNKKNDTIVPIYNRTTRPSMTINTSNVIKEKIKFTEISKFSQKKRKSTTTSPPPTTTVAEIKKTENKVPEVKEKSKITSTYSTSASVSVSSGHKSENDKQATKIKKKISTTTTTKAPLLTNSSSKKDESLAMTANTVTKISTSESNMVNTTATNSSSIALESKDGSVSLTTDKKKTSSGKKKKNKRRRKPASKESTALTSTNKIKNKNNAIGAQIYNYLSREIVPSLGVGLVGLMVTAGLASYFLYPFGVARRNFDIDRKDKGNYFYKDEYSGGMLEEDAIGQVIAGMPDNKLFPQTISKSSIPKNNYLNKFYRSNVQSPIQYSQPHKRFPQENVSALFEREDNKKFIEDNENKGNNIKEEKRFVVGSVQKEEIQKVTPAAVPEHGPRSLGLSRIPRMKQDSSESSKNK
ncbi:uncharacterized protein [Diabrotica undecimpunctata]|uniref:uncharacterized protein n=1 Tax=Diabrotica undecimpunctata TaxID=50387 RepID=UPI003B63A69F